MFRHPILTAWLSFVLCLAGDTAWAQVRSPAALPPPTVQNYPSGTFHGYFQEPYPNNILPRTGYDSPGTSGTQTDLGQSYYVPPYSPEYPYMPPTSRQSPGDRVSTFPYDTGRVRRDLIGRLPDAVPEVDSGYSSYTATDERARVRVRVPDNAVVWFDGTQTRSRGPVREYQSPSLTPGDTYTYTIRARWNQDGREVTQTQSVDVRAGAQAAITFPKENSSPAGSGASRR